MMRRYCVDAMVERLCKIWQVDCDMRMSGGGLMKVDLSGVIMSMTRSSDEEGASCGDTVWSCKGHDV